MKNHPGWVDEQLMTVQLPFWTWWINTARTVSRPLAALYSPTQRESEQSPTLRVCVRLFETLPVFLLHYERWIWVSRPPYCNNSVPKTRMQLLFPDKHRCSFNSCLLGLEREQRYLGKGGFDIKTAKSRAANNITIPVRRSSELYYIHMSRSIHKGSEDDPLDYMECWWQTGYGIQPCPDFDTVTRILRHLSLPYWYSMLIVGIERLLNDRQSFWLVSSK